MPMRKRAKPQPSFYLRTMWLQILEHHGPCARTGVFEVPYIASPGSVCWALPTREVNDVTKQGYIVPIRDGRPGLTYRMWLFIGRACPVGLRQGRWRVSTGNGIRVLLETAKKSHCGAAAAEALYHSSISTPSQACRKQDIRVVAPNVAELEFCAMLINGTCVRSPFAKCKAIQSCLFRGVQSESSTLPDHLKPDLGNSLYLAKSWMIESTVVVSLGQTCTRELAFKYRHIETRCLMPSRTLTSNDTK